MIHVRLLTISRRYLVASLPQTQTRTTILRPSRHSQSRQTTGSRNHIRRRRPVLHPLFLRSKHVQERNRRRHGSTPHAALVETSGELLKFEKNEGCIMLCVEAAICMLLVVGQF